MFISKYIIHFKLEDSLYIYRNKLIIYIIQWKEKLF